MKRILSNATLALCLGLGFGSAGAVTLGMSDTFSGLGTNGWSSGDANPTPPTRVAGGGPAGAGDGYLLLQASGTGFAGSKLVAFSGAQWAGDYTAAGVSAVRMDVNNFGTGDLHLRLAVDGSIGGSATSVLPITLAGGSGWTSVLFPLLPVDLIGPSPALALGNTFRFRLINTDVAGFTAISAAAQLGIDNVTAVPEPASVGMLALGLASLAAGARLRARRADPSAAGARCTVV